MVAIHVRGSGAAVPGAASAKLIAVTAMAGPLDISFVVIVVEGYFWGIARLPGDGTLHGRLVSKGARGAVPDYEDELDDEDENPDGDKEDLIAACIDRLLVWGQKCRGARGGGDWLGGLAHDIGSGATLLQPLY